MGAGSSKKIKASTAQASSTILSFDFICMFLFQFIEDVFSGEFPVKPGNGRGLHRKGPTDGHR